MFKKLAAVAVIAGAALFGVITPAQAAEQTPVVLDGGDMFSADQEIQLTSTIQGADEKYGLRFVVETVGNLDGKDIVSYTEQRATELGVGDGDTDNGVLILTSRDDHKVQVQTGNGVAPKVSDSDVQSIADSTIIPQFREGNFYQGTVDGINAVGAKYTNEPTEEQSGGYYQALNDVNTAILFFIIKLIAVVAFLIVFFAFILPKIRRTIKRVKREREYEAKKKKIAEAAAIEAKKNAHIRVVKKAVAGAVDALMASEKQEVNFLRVSPKNRERIANEALTDVFAEFPDEDQAELTHNFAEEFLRRQKRIVANKHRAFNLTYNEPQDFEFERPSFLAALDTYEERCKKARKDDDHRREVQRKQRAEEQRLREERAQSAKREREAREAAAAERKRLEKAAAKTLWEKIPAEGKRSIKNARTKGQKVSALGKYNDSPLDNAVMFGVLCGLYSSQIGAPTSDYYGSSSRASSSSTYDSGYTPRSSSHSSHSSHGSSGGGSYSSPSYDSGSYGGGSFDSGSSGGGSW
jgi:uncharacterized membrane protein YgcG